MAFADKRHKPIPIHYELTPGAIKSIMQYQVAPRSNALIQVKVVNSSQFAGKEVVLSPINEDEDDDIIILDHEEFKDDISAPEQLMIHVNCYVTRDILAKPDQSTQIRFCFKFYRDFSFTEFFRFQTSVSKLRNSGSGSV